MIFIQPSSKLLPVEIKCPTVIIVQSATRSEETCFHEKQFHLISSNSLNNVTSSSSSSVLLLPYSLQHDLEPIITTQCSDKDLVYSFYLLSIDPSQWKYSRTQRYSPMMTNPSFQDTFLDNYCSRFGLNSTLTIEPKSLAHGYYVSVFTISRSSNLADFRQFIQPIEIIRSDLISTFGGNETLTNDVNELHLDFYSTTIDPDNNEFDRRKLNYTLLCYPEYLQSTIFLPHTIPLGSSRPTETNPQNINHWSIQWTNFNLLYRRSDIHLHIYENQCFSSSQTRESIRFDLNTKILRISDDELIFNNGTLHFLLIIRHLMDGRQLVARLEVDRQMNVVFDTTDLSALEDVMGNLDDLASSNPKKAVEFISGLADKLNEMSDNSVSEHVCKFNVRLNRFCFYFRLQEIQV